MSKAVFGVVALSLALSQSVALAGVSISKMKKKKARQTTQYNDYAAASTSNGFRETQPSRPSKLVEAGDFSQAAGTSHFDAPPAYSEEVQKYNVPEGIKRKNQQEFVQFSSQYENSLKNLQIVLVVDHSGSQGAGDEYPLKGKTPTGMLKNRWTQWDNTFMIAKYISESVLEYDADGQVPVVFFSSDAQDVVLDDVGDMLDKFKEFKPSGSTNLYGALKLAFQKHMAHEAGQGTVFIVLTDGQPNSGQESQIKSLIRNEISRKDPKGELLNILFIRIGDDPNAIAFLEQLDDCREIGANVDTKSDNMVYKMGPKNMILNTIFEHLDHQYRE